jgi:hypothetical protein
MLPDFLARRPLLPLVLVTWMVFIGFVAMPNVGGDSTMVLRRLGPVLLVGVGASMMVAGARRRVGRAEYCAACDYEKRADSTVCPECGAAWDRPGGTVRGHVKQNRILFWCGLIVLVAYLTGPFSALVAGRSLHLRFVPTAVLIDRVGADGFARGAWDELRYRRLSTEQAIRLAERLLDKRRRGNTLRYEDRVWLATTVKAGVLPADLQQRYYQEQ